MIGVVADDEFHLGGGVSPWSYYEQAQSIATLLFERAEFDWSRRIEDAISGGATATEILIRVRFTLRELLLRGHTTPTERHLSQDLIAEIDDVLSR
jgi:hypothetical protein